MRDGVGLGWGGFGKRFKGRFGGEGDRMVGLFGLPLGLGWVGKGRWTLPDMACLRVEPKAPA